MDFYKVFVLLHVVGTVLGVGGATYADVYFLRNIKKKVGNIEESEALKTAILLIRAGLVILLISGFSLIVFWRISGHGAALLSTQFLAKMTIVLVILVNGLLLESKKIPVTLGGPISTVSWYGALVLGVLGRLNISYYLIVGFYLVALLGAILTFKIIRSIYKVSL